MTTNINDLSPTELRALVAKQIDVISQKDRQITHLTKNAQKWVQKFDKHQNQVAESVIKKFEMEFEHERNELQAKLARMSEMQGRLVKRCSELQAAAKSDQTKTVKGVQRIERIAEPVVEINMLAEPASVTEMEFSNEMKMKLAKYAT
jgi:ABC-type transporter Mla subunit MlaD